MCIKKYDQIEKGSNYIIKVSNKEYEILVCFLCKPALTYMTFHWALGEMKMFRELIFL